MSQRVKNIPSQCMLLASHLSPHPDISQWCTITYKRKWTLFSSQVALVRLFYHNNRNKTRTGFTVSTPAASGLEQNVEMRARVFMAKLNRVKRVLFALKPRELWVMESGIWLEVRPSVKDLTSRALTTITSESQFFITHSSWLDWTDRIICKEC